LPYTTATRFDTIFSFSGLRENWQGDTSDIYLQAKIDLKKKSTVSVESNLHCKSDA
jgi:hypothetical protein